MKWFHRHDYVPISTIFSSTGKKVATTVFSQCSCEKIYKYIIKGVRLNLRDITE